MNRVGPLRASHPRDGEKIEPGRIYVARPNHHLMVEDGNVRSWIGPLANGYRPSVNVLFESAARAFGPQVVGVVLSGSLDDGTLGLQAIKRASGNAIVQDPAEVAFTGMLQSALDHVEVDYCLPAVEIARTLNEESRKEAETDYVLANMDQERQAMTDEQAVSTSVENVAGFTCPECGGALREERSGTLLGYRCHVGHYLSERALLRAQGNTLEAALWTALRIIEERIELAERITQRAEDRGNTLIADRFKVQNRDAHRKAEIIRRVLLGGDGLNAVSELQQDLVEYEPAESAADSD